MKIIIASTIVPFIDGGGTFIVDWTAKKLQEYGHKVEVFKIPFDHSHPFVVEQMLALRLLNVAQYSDRLISIRTPSYILDHPNHVSWFIHQYRYAYDLWNTKYQTGIPITRDGLSERDAVITADNYFLRKIKKIFTNSIEVKNRLLEYNQIESEVLYPPLLYENNFYCSNYGDYIYYSSRIAQNKRQLLAVQAMKFTKSNVKLLITGYSDSNFYIQDIKSFVEKEGLNYKVKIINRWISEQEKAKFFSKCLASIYIPYDEDSYGYPSLESFKSKKCVITCTDSGGTGELIQNNYNGFIVDPSPSALAQAMDQLYLNKQKAKELGENAYSTLKKMNISWDNVINKLTAKY